MQEVSLSVCSIEEVDQQQASDFLRENHAQGQLKAAFKTKNIALVHQEEIIALAQFGYPRTVDKQRKYSFELYRLAFKNDTRIHNGASALIGHFRKTHKPADFFTYQDTTGENSSVYKASGMKLVKDGAKTKKQYLVAPGKTLATGSRKEVLGIPYANRYGPDRILGTKLGEDPERNKTNIDLFLSLGWHLEETTGDSVWEWVDPNLTFYVYKITAADSDKYYIGVSHVKKAKASKEDCLNDGYYGSGSKLSENNKFLNWKEKHKGTLKKAVIKVFSRRKQAYNLEEELIGDSWKNDSQCLNSCPGGTDGGFNLTGSPLPLKECTTNPSHGLKKHWGDICTACSTAARFTQKYCSPCGLETTHREDDCLSCFNRENMELAECATHGFTTFQLGECARCSARQRQEMKYCPAHKRETLHQSNSCYTCAQEGKISLKECSIHGESKHSGDSCYSCMLEAIINTKHCASCSEKTTHFADSCAKCAARKKFVEDTCSTHGLTTFYSTGICVACDNQKRITLQHCNKCKQETKHQGSTCSTCKNKSLIQVKWCEKHQAETKHRGNSCYKCSSEKRKDRATAPCSLGS